MGSRSISRRAVAALVGGALLLGAASCSRDDPKAQRHPVLVARKAVPRGTQVQAMVDAGAIGTDVVPGDLVEGEVVSSLADVRCLVLLVDLPQGTVLRRSYVGEPSKVGLTTGLGPQGTEVPCA